jgi:hypothetical protein
MSIHVLNPAQASEYMDSLRNERQRSAVLAIHLAWLDHSPPPARGERLEPETPLDMLILYQAAAKTFSDWPPRRPTNGLPVGGRVTNREQALRRIQAIEDEETRLVATVFARHVIDLSKAAEEEQDLNYFVELFLRTVEDHRVIENIVSGEISRHSDKIAADPDYW